MSTRPIFSKREQIVIVRLAQRGFAAAFGLIGLFIAVALLSYHPEDPGLYSATWRSAQNWLGEPGALFADGALRMFGFAGYAVAAIAFSWSARLAFGRVGARPLKRLAVTPFAVVALAAFASSHAATSPVGGGLGGLVGDFLFGVIAEGLPLQNAKLRLVIATLICGAAAAPLLAYAMGCTPDGVRDAVRKARQEWAAAAGALTATAESALRPGSGPSWAPASGRDSDYAEPPEPFWRTMFNGWRSDAPLTAAPTAPRATAETPWDAAEPTPFVREQTVSEAPTANDDALSAASPRRDPIARVEPDFAGVPGQAEPDRNQNDERREPEVIWVRTSDRLADLDPDALRAEAGAGEEGDAGGSEESQRPRRFPGSFGRVSAALASQEQSAFEPALDRPEEAPASPQTDTVARPADAFAETDAVDDDVVEAATKPRSPRPQSIPTSRWRTADRRRASLIERLVDDGATPPSFARANVEPEAAETNGGAGAADPQPIPPRYATPPLALLTEADPERRMRISERALAERADRLQNVLRDFNVKGDIVDAHPGPVVTLFELEPAPGLKASRVTALADDIARSVGAVSARISTVPGRNVIGIELPNAQRETVLLSELLADPSFAKAAEPLTLALGKDIAGAPITADLARMPHLLVAGTTGAGKSVSINAMLLSLLFRNAPEDLRLLLIDPKMLELSMYDGVPHLLAPVVTEPTKAVSALKWIVREMEARYERMSELGVRGIDGYNKRMRETSDPAAKPMPRIVVVVDEMADLMLVAGREVEHCIQRLAQMARAAGIHLIMATQRPSVDVITGTIKANFPVRMSFQVRSKIDSRTILGEGGAEQLLGRGDSLFSSGGGQLARIHGPFVSDREVEAVAKHLRSLGLPEDSVAFDAPEGDDATSASASGMATSDDALYERAVAVVSQERRASTSLIQRRLQIGYNRAARIVEMMEERGVVSAANHVGKREVLIEGGAA